MQKRAPTLANILVIVLFALSCFGLMLFLWESFGGSVPLKSKGYRFTIAFSRTLELAEQSDVRISGVDVGHVVALKLGKQGKAIATIELDSSYAPIRADDHALLRLKSLLGETYVELIPKVQSGPFVADGGRLAETNVERAVTLDDILSTFNSKTRVSFQEWMQEMAAGFNGRGEDINASLAALDPFVEKANDLVGVMAAQEGAVRQLVHNTGVTFNALAAREEQLQGLIVNGEHTFAAAAKSSKAFANAFRELPKFESSSATALRSLDSFADDASPLLDQLKPFERQLAPTLKASEPFAPQLSRFVDDLGPLTKASKQGLPAFSSALNKLTPILGHLPPVLHNLDPFLQYLGEYEPELQAFFANVTAASEARGTNADDPSGPYEHYLRTLQTVTPESLAVTTSRIGTNRSNPYPKSGAFSSLGSGGLQVFNGANCSDSAPSVSGPPNATVSQGIIEQLIELHVANDPGSPNSVPAPACSQQSPFTFNGQTSQFPHADTVK